MVSRTVPPVPSVPAVPFVPAGPHCPMGQSLGVSHGTVPNPGVIVIRLPLPPTANHIWTRTRKGMRKAGGYVAWLRESGWMVKEQRPGRIAGKYALTITAVRPDRRRRDLDNLIKPTSDLLVEAGVITDDCLCESITVRWSTEGEGLAVTVEAVPALLERRAAP